LCTKYIIYIYYIYLFVKKKGNATIYAMQIFFKIVNDSKKVPLQLKKTKAKENSNTEETETEAETETAKEQELNQADLLKN